MFKKDSLMTEESQAFIKKLIIIAVFVFLLLFLYKISSILIILGFALFLNLLFAPFLNYLNKLKIRDGLGMVIIYLIILFLIFIVFFAMVPIFVKQLELLASRMAEYINHLKIVYEAQGIDGLGIPSYLQGFLGQIDIHELLDSLKNNLNDISFFIAKNLKNFLSSGAGIVFSITDAVIHFVLIFVFTFFIALDRKGIRNLFYKVLPINTSNYILSKEDQIISTLANWVKGQVILGLSIFTVTLLGLLFIRIFGIRINEFFTLAIIAGMMEFVPYIGPFLALLPALAIAAGFGLHGVLIVLALYIIIQQLENHVLVPYIMGKALALAPFAVLLGMVIGANLMGIAGIIVAVPAVSVIQIFLSDYLKRKK